MTATKAVHNISFDPHNMHVFASYSEQDMVVKVWDMRKMVEPVWSRVASLCMTALPETREWSTYNAEEWSASPCFRLLDRVCKRLAYFSMKSQVQ